MAEYRAYQYLVTNKVPTVDDPKGQYILSTLDPVTFIAYNGGRTVIDVDLLRTWICPGDTSHKKICDSPYKKLVGVQAP